MTPVELAWAAGLFEGEGSVRISKPAARNWGSLNVDVPNTDQSIVQFFYGRWGGSVREVPAQGNRRTYWRWRLAARQAVPFLEAIRPYLVTDRVRQRVDHGLAFQAQKRSRCSTESYREDQWNAYWWMAELNVRGVRDAVA
jgi:hypothetical protein